VGERCERRETRKRAGPPTAPAFIPPQLAQLVKEPPAGPEWAHEIMYDGYRIHALIHRGRVKLLSRTGTGLDA
jgi:bifunctional non-homologous end joining protein LigD